ncbi:unnamed protein product [Clavelina lepadiformis]|uniref:Uncharacterized protein n=1 Tax=Clavelina lepadiformis TaxID=159417 RepID=A0ABP0G0U4_CLALP
MKGPKKYLVNYMVPNVQFTLQKVLTGLKISQDPLELFAISQDSNKHFETNSNKHFETNSNKHFETHSNKHFETHSNKHFETR